MENEQKERKGNIISKNLGYGAKVLVDCILELKLNIKNQGDKLDFWKMPNEK